MRWELLNKRWLQFTIFGLGEWETCPLRPSFAVCRIRGVPLIEDFEWGLCFIQYRINLHSRTNPYLEHIGHTFQLQFWSKVLGHLTFLPTYVLSVHLHLPLPPGDPSKVYPLFEHWFLEGVFSKLNNDFPLNASAVDILSSVSRSFRQDCPNKTFHKDIILFTSGPSSRYEELLLF